MDFAPYQSSPPETTRKSLTLSRSSPKSQPSAVPYFKPSSAYPTHRSYSPIPSSPPPGPERLSPSPPPWANTLGSSVTSGSGGGGGGSGGGGFGVNIAGFGSSREMVEQFETSLPIRLDYEAMLAYLLLPPAGSVLLLILEHKSDYVRFHAWQGSLLFTALAILHFILSFSSFLSYSLLTVDLVLIAWLSWSAYRDADTLDRCEVPWFGPLASSILDDE